MGVAHHGLERVIRGDGSSGPRTSHRFHAAATRARRHHRDRLRSGERRLEAGRRCIAALIGEGLKADSTVLRARLVDVNSLDAGGFKVVIAAAGANGARLNAAARAARALCVTMDVEAVRSGLCAMAITSAPRVQITLNHAVAAAAGIEFVAAFRMMIQEL
jgi:hypothetical protein